MATTNSPVKHFFDQSFQGKEKQLNVQIQLSKSRLYLAYFHATHNSYVGIEEYDLGENKDWNQAYSKIEKHFSALNQKHKAYSIAIIDPYFTLVPTPLFSSTAAKDYLQLNHRENEEKLSYQHQAIESANTTIVYAIPEQLNQLIRKHFTIYKLHHYSSPLIEYSEINKPSIEEHLQLHIQKNHFEVIYYKLGKLRFFNSFQYTTTEDFLYFFLYVIEQLNINREKLKLHLYGEFEKNDELYTTLYKYINELHITPLPKELRFSTVLSTLPIQYYRNIYNQYLCE